MKQLLILIFALSSLAVLSLANEHVSMISGSSHRNDKKGITIHRNYWIEHDRADMLPVYIPEKDSSPLGLDEAIQIAIRATATNTQHSSIELRNITLSRLDDFRLKNTLWYYTVTLESKSSDRVELMILLDGSFVSPRTWTTTNNLEHASGTDN